MNKNGKVTNARLFMIHCGSPTCRQRLKVVTNSVGIEIALAGAGWARQLQDNDDTERWYCARCKEPD